MTGGKGAAQEAVLGARQTDILEHLAEFCVSTAEQINRDVFGGLHSSLVYRELRRLRGKKLLDVEYFERNGRAKGAYVLTPRGMDYLALLEPEVRRTKRIRPQALLHDLELVDIAHRLRKLRAVKRYHTENRLISGTADVPGDKAGRFADLRPDALMELERDGKGYFFAVEYEASRKYEDRTAEKINRYYDTPEVFGLLLITKTGELADRIRATEKKNNPEAKAKVYYGTLEEVKKSEGKMTFFGKGGEKFTVA